MFNEVLKISYDLLKKNTNLTQHLFLFFLITMFVIPNIGGMKGMLFIIVFSLFVCAFFAGWFNAIKTAYRAEFPQVDCFVNEDNDRVEISKNKDSDNEFNLPPLYFKEFFEGVGKYFLKFLCGGLVYVVIFGVCFYLLNYFIHHFVVIPPAIKQIDINSLSVMTQDELNKIVLSLNMTEQLKVLKLAGLISGAFMLLGYVTLLFPVVLVNSEKNVFYCLFLSIKSLFKNIPLSFFIYFIFNSLLFLLSIGFSNPNNLIIFFISFILYCYLSLLYYLSLFVYYEKTK